MTSRSVACSDPDRTHSSGMADREERGEGMFADLERVTVDDSGFTMQHTPVEGRGTIAAGHEDPDESAAMVRSCKGRCTGSMPRTYRVISSGSSPVSVTRVATSRSLI